MVTYSPIRFSLVILVSRLMAKNVEAEVARCSVHSSCCSARTAPTSRAREVRSGKMPTTSVRRRISRFSRSWGLLDQICRQAALGSR
jgi:hypothetical protein